MEDRKATFGKRLRYAMERKDIKAADLSRLTGIDKGSISHFLNDGYYPKVDILNKLSKALGVSYSWLSGVEDELFQYIKEKAPTNQEDLELLELWHRLNDVQKLAVRKTIEAFLNN